MAKPLNIPPYSLVRLHLVCNGAVEILLDLARTLDVKRVIDQRVQIVGKVPANRVTRRVSVSAPGLNRRRNEKQPEEHDDRRQSNGAPRNQIGLLRQFGYLSLVKRTPLGIRFRSASNASLERIRSFTPHTEAPPSNPPNSASRLNAVGPPLFHSQFPTQLPKVQSFGSLLDGLNLDSLSAGLDSLSMDRSLTD